MCLLFCDVDDQGKIVESLYGDKVIPMRQYQHFFFLTDDIAVVNQNLPNYVVIDGQLTIKP